MTDASIIEQVQLHFELTHPGYVAFDIPWQSMLDTWHALSRAGNSKSSIVNYWKSHGVSADDAGTFATAMQQIEAGQTIQDPNESPSFGEIVGSYNIPWGKILLAGIAYVAVTQVLPKYLK